MRPLRDDPRDLDDLALGERQVLDEGARIDRAHAEPGKDRIRFFRHASAVDQAEPSPRLAANEQVLGDCHPRQERELLEDGPDPERVRALGTVHLDSLPVDADFARIRAQPAAEELDQRALAGAVFADKSVHLTLARREGCAVQRPDAAERLREPKPLKGRRRRFSGGAGRRPHVVALGSLTSSRPGQGFPSVAASTHSFTVAFGPLSVKSAKKLSGRFGNTVTPTFTVSLVT